jgi:hypothetical protein
MVVRRGMAILFYPWLSSRISLTIVSAPVVATTRDAEGRDRCRYVRTCGERRNKFAMPEKEAIECDKGFISDKAGRLVQNEFLNEEAL